MGATDGNLAALAAHLSRCEEPRPGDAREFCDGATNSGGNKVVSCVMEKL